MKKEIKGGSKPVVYLISVLVGFLVTFAVMLIFAAITVAADLPDGFSVPFASVSAAAGAFVSAFIASKRLRQNGLLNGLITGGAMFLIIALVALISSRGGVTLNTLFNFVILVLSGLIGGVVGLSGKREKIF